MNYYEIDRMPSVSEIEHFMGNNFLTNKLAKTSGMYVWAKQLGLTVKKSETLIGIKGEKWVKDVLEKRTFSRRNINQARLRLIRLCGALLVGGVPHG